MSRVKAHECDRCGVVEKVPVPPNMVNAPRRAPGWTTVRVEWPRRMHDGSLTRTRVSTTMVPTPLDAGDAQTYAAALLAADRLVKAGQPDE